MNWTLPGRAHVMIRHGWVWLTLWLFGWRLHWTSVRLPAEGSHARLT